MVLTAMDIKTATAWIRTATFARPTDRPVRIGLEAELIPIDPVTREPASISNATLPAVKTHAARSGWRQIATTKGAPRFAVPGGGSLTFEPGGQIEYATAPFESPSALLTHSASTIASLTDSLRAGGIELIGAGIDPFNGPGNAALQIDAERYRCMDAYYATLGNAGARMMRQTASIQINVDGGEDPLLSWRVLNALTPVLTAIFANSRHYAGSDTGYSSYRSHTWQTLDGSRTGIVSGDGDAAAHYAQFALDATAMFMRSGTGEFLPFRHWVERGVATPEATRTHLSTLFPEVRPRRYYEVRSIDALPPTMYAAPVMLIAGLLLDADALNEAAVLLDGHGNRAMLESAARIGLRDPWLGGTAEQIVEIALAGCSRMTESCRGQHIDEAKEFFDRFTLQQRSPGDEAAGSMTVATAA